MSRKGPEPPNYLPEKRKRSFEDNGDMALSPRPSSSSVAGSEKKQRTVGPTLPPHLQRSENGSSSDSDSDDDFGPGLPSTDSFPAEHVRPAKPPIVDSATPSKPTQRDEWMLIPPSQSDWSSRVDPTKLRNRKFNTGRGSRPIAQADGDNAVWIETPEQKKQRLQDEVMGIHKSSHAQVKPNGPRPDRKTERKIQKYNDKARGATLYDEHQRTNTEKEDDPSARAFDREKDIAGGVKIDHAKKKEMLNRASHFGSRFSGGNFL